MVHRETVVGSWPLKGDDATAEAESAIALAPRHGAWLDATTKTPGALVKRELLSHRWAAV